MIMVTGAAGFLGSAVTVDLCRDCKVVAIDRRTPTGDLLRCAPGARGSRADIADAGLWMRLLLGSLKGEKPYERPWMLRYVDRPWAADPTHTQRTLGWNCTQGMSVLDRIPTILSHFRRYPGKWEYCNASRNHAEYRYDCANP